MFVTRIAYAITLNEPKSSTHARTLAPDRKSKAYYPSRSLFMNLIAILFGKWIRTEDEQQEKISPLPGIPILGLDALASAAYGPEAALTVLLPLVWLPRRISVPSRY